MRERGAVRRWPPFPLRSVRGIPRVSGRAPCARLRGVPAALDAEAGELVWDEEWGGVNAAE